MLQNLRLSINLCSLSNHFIILILLLIDWLNLAPFLVLLMPINGNSEMRIIYICQLTLQEAGGGFKSLPWRKIAFLASFCDPIDLKEFDFPQISMPPILFQRLKLAWKRVCWPKFGSWNVIFWPYLGLKWLNLKSKTQN